MITLPEKFRQRADVNDTRRIILVHLYYDGENYLPCASTQTLIEGRQYLGILKNVSDITQKWNIEGQNQITITSPRIHLSDYGTPEGYTIMTEFLNRNYYGRPLKIYLTYEGLLLEDSLKVFDGWIEDINYSGSQIEITGKTSVIPEIDISGSRVDFDKQTIGALPAPAGYNILRDFDKHILPVPFGQHWCAPLVPYIQEGTQQWKRFYASSDNNYSILLKCEDNIRTDTIHHNIGVTTSQILHVNDNYFTPFYQKDWSSSLLTAYSVVSPEPLNPGISVPFQGGHTKSDNSLFLAVPLRYTVRDDLPNWFTISGVQSHDNQATIKKVFDNTDSTAFNIINNPQSMLNLKVKLSLSVDTNLKSDEKGHVRKTRKIHIPTTSSNNGGQGYLLGRWAFNIGAQGNFSGGQWVTVDTFPVVVHHWKGNYIASQMDTESQSLPSFIGSGTAGLLTPDDVKTQPYFYTYNMQARVFSETSGAEYYQFGNNAQQTRRVGLQGNENLTDKMGLAPFIIREAFADGDVGSTLEVYCHNITLNHPSNDNTAKLYKLYHLTAGSVDFTAKDNLYGAVRGAKLKTSNSLLSTPQNTSEYQLRRPYEYVELLIRKSGETKFGTSFSHAKINEAWDSLFSSKRDYSGFVIHSETKLDNFIRDYVRDEPFSIFVSEDGAFNIAMLKNAYSPQDAADTISYSDAVSFNMYMTPSKQLAAGIDSVKTDYMYGLDEYSIDCRFRLRENEYNYGFWKHGNTSDNNSLKAGNIEKKYTSSVIVDTVIYNGKHYGCVRTNSGVQPGDGIHWLELTTPVATQSWNAGTLYTGEDAEAYMIAKFTLNQWANRHRMVNMATENLAYLRFNVGDIVMFDGVPHSLLGIPIKGFAGNNNFTYLLNGQTIYAAFIITEIKKSLKRVELTAMQLHDLNAYNPERY